MGATDRSAGGPGRRPPFRSLERLRYDQERGLYRASYDPVPEGGLLVDIVLAVAEVLDVAPTEIEQAHRALDIGAFERWVVTPAAGDGPDGRFEFRLDDCRVKVAADEITFERLR